MAASDRLAPASQLRLEWVYGYRGHQCRNNIQFTSNGDIVYFVAGIGIVYEIKNRQQKFFLMHDDDIVSLGIHPNRQHVATGQVGKAPMIYVWDTVTLQVLSILKDGGHTHGIPIVGFSRDGNRLVSVGMDPNYVMNIWEWKKGKVLSTTRAHSDRVFDCQFLPSDMNQMVSCGVKHIKFWTLSGNVLSSKRGVFGNKGVLQTMFCLAFGEGNVVYSGAMSGDVYVWIGGQLNRVIQGVHSGAIFSVDSTEVGFCTAGKDTKIQLFDTQCNLISTINVNISSLGMTDLAVRSICWREQSIVVGTLNSEIILFSLNDPESPQLLMTGHGEGELWALALHPQSNVFATGSDDQTLRLWNITSGNQIGKITLTNKIRSCAFNNTGELLAAGLLDGSFVVFHSRDFSAVFQTKYRKEVIHEMKFSPDGKFLAVGSNDNFVDIYDVNQNFKRVGECRGNSSFITHLDWSVDSLYLQTNSGAAEHLIFKAPLGKQVVDGEEIRSIKWFSYTCVLGSVVNGIWEKYTDTNDVNSLDVNFQFNVVATGDDFGLVKLFNYPSLQKGAHYRKYIGHSAHVTNVRWTADKSRLISIGGGDHSVCQWAFIPSGVKPLKNGVVEDEVATYTDSNTEGSDSEVSDVPPLDSELEREKQQKYDRSVYKEDLHILEEEARKEVPPNLKRKRAPDEGLKLEFVHGYRGYDCRNNVFFTQTGELIYHVAAAGIVYNRETHKQRFYTQHTDDILCIAIHPLKDFVATGQVGRDAAIHVWDVDSLTTLSILKGYHQRGVCAVDFSSDGRKLASVGLDDDHCLAIWDWRKGEKLATARGHKDKIFVIKWKPSSDDKLVNVGVRHVSFWTQAGGGLTSRRGTFGKVSKLDTQLCVAFSATDTSICYTGCLSGHILIWKENVLQSIVQGHTGGVFAMQSLDKGFVTGGKDGKVCLFNEDFSTLIKTFALTKNAFSKEGRGCLTVELPCIRAVALYHGSIVVGTVTGELVEMDREGSMRILAQGHREGELWGLGVHSELAQFATVSDDATLRVWQVRPGDHQMLKYFSLKQGARCVDFSPDGKHLAVGFKNGSFAVYSLQDFTEVIAMKDRQEEVSDIKFSPNPGKYLAVGSHDNFVDIYNTLTKQRVGVCKGASSYITHIDWDMRGKLLMVNSGAKELLFFEAPRGTRQVISLKDLETMGWYSWTGVLGECCQGIWPPKSDITDVNGASLNPTGQLLATGDDFGHVKLFEFPVKTKFAKYKQYDAHSSHVANVRWLRDDSHLISVGGADTAIMVWRHCMPSTATTANLGVTNATAAKGASEVSDTDSEEEGGYDSDVQREKSMNYSEKTYASSSLKERISMKPSEKSTSEVQTSLKAAVSRVVHKPPKIQPHPWIEAMNKEHPSDPERPRRRSVESSTQRNSKNAPQRPAHQRITDLQLSYVYGYRGFDSRNNAHYLDIDGEEIVYHAAGVGIVHNLKTGKQRFYVEHTDDILCLAVNRHPKCTGIVATAQLGETPVIYIWNVTTCATLSCLQGTHTQGICCLDFSCTGKHLLSVGLDPSHMVVVWRWNEGVQIGSSKGHRMRIFHAEFRPDSDSQFVTVGVKHVKFWSIVGNQLIFKRGNLSTLHPNEHPKMTTFLSIAFGAGNVTFTGAMSGDVWVWNEHSLHRIIQRVHSGSVFALFTTLKDGLIVSGGKEKGKDTGSIKVWDPQMNQCKPFYLRDPSKPTGDSVDKLEVVKSISRVKGKILVGTNENNIIEIQEKTGALTAIINGHCEGELWGLTVHPTQQRFCTSSDDGTLRIWDISQQQMLMNLRTGGSRCVDYSPSGQLIAAGLNNGGFLVLNSQNYRLLSKCRDRGKTVNDIRFSPDARYLVVGSDDKCVDIYEIQLAQKVGERNNEGNSGSSKPGSLHSGASGDRGQQEAGLRLTRVAYCKGIQSEVVQMDFSANSQFLKVTTASCDIVVFRIPSGEEVTDQPTIDDITWSSWTTVIGDEMKGVWPENASKWDVNCCHVSHMNNIVVTGDDYGLVKLFPFPCPPKSEAYNCLVGHSAHVTKVRFTHDDSYLISVGGDDCCIFVWKTLGEEF